MAAAGQKPKGLIVPLVETAAGLGIVQGLVWTSLSLIALLFYHKQIDEPSTMNLGHYIYNIFLDKLIDYSENDYVVGSPQFSYFMYIYLALSMIWLAISCGLLWVVLKGKTDNYYDATIAAWTVDAILLSLLDLILLSLIASDYNLLQKRAVIKVDYQMHFVAIGIVMTLAARGFILWIINLIFIVVLGKHWYQRYHKGVGRDRPVIDAYSAGSRLPPWQSGPSMYNEPSEYDNKGFKDDNDTLPYPPSKYLEEDRRKNNGGTREYPQINLRKPNPDNNDYSNDNYWRNANQHKNDNKPSPRPYLEQEFSSPYLQPAPQKTAKIGRQGGQRSPPLHVPSPYIPDPDYSPPGSPKVRGVLRPKSNYLVY